MIIVCLILTVLGKLDCPYDLCNPVFIGDGECDLGCMLPECNYDSASTSEDKYEIMHESDCFSTCTSTCSEFTLGDDSCDIGKCDIEACAFDLGDCGYCANGCFKLDLSEDPCKPECKNLACRYGDNTCGWCAESCFRSNPGDKECQEPCKVEACDYDDGDCPVCNVNCEWSMIGNGTCDDACNVSECDFDESDCICGDNCTLTMRSDTTQCFTECDYKDCNWQNGTCGYCASGCMQEMLGNGQCDHVCYTEDCSYDGGDCGCANNCLEEDLGTCKEECLVISCDWDPECNDQIKRFQAVAYQIIEDDFTEVFKFEDECEADDCELQDLVDGYNFVCKLDCTECIGQLGGCSESHNICRPSCRRCSNDDNNICLECDNQSMNKYNEFGECVETCSIGHVSKLICFDDTLDNDPENESSDKIKEDCSPDKVYYLCVDQDDPSSEDNPVVYMVGFENESTSTESVFSSIEDAFDNIWNAYTVLKLKATTHVLMNNLGGSEGEQSQSGQYDNVNLTIETDCDDPCTEKAAIYLLSTNVRFPTKFASLTVRNVIIDASLSLDLDCGLPDCDDEECEETVNHDYVCNNLYCKYCPYINSSGGIYYNDRDEDITSSLGDYNVDDCIEEGIELFDAEYDFSLENCEIRDYRQNQSKFINMRDHNLTIKNTVFHNVMSYGENDAFIVVECQEEEEACSSTFSMEGGSVSYVNNGYEYSVELRQYSFISIGNIASVVIKDVQFSYNTVICDVDEPCSSFINIEGAFKTEITGCEFTDSFFMDSLIMLNLSQIDLDDITVDSENKCVECREINVNIYDNIFRNIGLTKSLIEITETSYVPNIYISSNQIDFAVIANDVISISKDQGFSDVDINGGDQSFNINGSKNVVYTDPKTLKIENNTISSSSFNTVLSLNNVPNILIENITITETVEDSSFSSVLSSYMAGSCTYMIKEINDLPELNLKTYFSISSPGNLDLFELEMDRLVCQDQPCFLYFETILGSVRISNLDISSIKSTGTNTALILITGDDSGQLTLENLTFSHIENPSGTEIIKISEVGNIEITEMNMSHILSHTNGALLIEEALSVQITDSTWFNVTSDAGSGGCISITMSGRGSENFLSIDSSNFTNCEALTKGGAINLSQIGSDEGIRFQVASSDFTFNSAHTGSVMYITDSVTFAENSLISSCNFKSNAASVSGGLDTVHTHGTLHIDSCLFSENTGSANSVQGNFNTNETLLIISNTEFSDNEGEGALAISSFVPSTMTITENCTFRRNTPIAVSFLTASWTDTGSEFSENKMALSLQIYSFATLTDTEVFNNNGSSQPVCKISSSSHFACTNCKFEGNTSIVNGAGLTIETSSTCILDSCSFTNCSSTKRGSAITFANTYENNSIKNTQFTLNSATEGGTVNIVDSKVSFDYVTFSQNTATQGGSGITANSAEILVENSTFQDQEGELGVFLEVTTESNVQVSNSEFTNSSADIGGMLSIASSNLLVSDSSFRNGSSNSNAGGIYSYSRSKVEIYNSKFEDITSGNESGHVSVDGGSLYVESSEFKNLPNGGILTYTLDSMIIKNSTFESGSRKYNGGALYIEDNNIVQIELCSFTGVSSQEKGGAIYLISNMIETEDSHISDSKFTDNTGINGGALYLDNVSLVISSSSFVSNSALDSGGAIYLSCDSDGECSVDIHSNTLTENTGVNNGGGIAWEVKRPVVYGNTNLNNEATYGNDLASFPILIAEYNGRVLTEYNGRVLTEYNGRVLTEYDGRLLTEREVVSGQLLNPPVILALIDHYGEVVTTANDFTAQLSLNGNNTALKGDSLVYSSSGIFNFSNVYVTAEVNTQVELTFSSSSLESIASIDNDQAKQSSITIEFTSRECLPGEYYFLYECVVCNAGTYSLSPENSCADCPSTAECYGGASIAPRPGYWRSTNSSETIYECFNSDACLGGLLDENGNMNLTGVCSEGYRGHLCQACDNGYSRTSKNRCGECPETSANVLILLGFIILIVILCFVMIRSSLRSAYQTKALHSIYIKILVNYMQLVMLTAQFRLDWPEEVVNLLQIQEQSGQVTDQFFSIDCFLETEEDDSYIEVFYSKLAIIAFLPLMLAFFAFSFWGIYALVQGDRTVLKEELITTLCVLFFLIHPTITRFMFSMFACQDIDGNYWLLENLDIQCWTERHVMNSLMIGLPSIIVWVMGVPTFILVVLTKRKKMLKKTSEKLKFGFLYNGYKLDHYYWEFVILYRKVAIICCAVFLSSVSIPIQALICFSLLIACLHMQYTIKPFDRKELNQMETRAIIVATVTIYCGLYYLTNDLSEEGKVLFLVIMITANAYFLLFWMYYFCHAALVVASKFIPALRDKVNDGTNVDKQLLTLIASGEESFDERALGQILSMRSPVDFYRMVMYKRIRKPIVNRPMPLDAKYQYSNSSLISDWD